MQEFNTYHNSFYDQNALLTKLEVKMAWYRSSFFLRLSKFLYVFSVIINKKKVCWQDHNDQLHDAHIFTQLRKLSHQFLININSVLLQVSSRKLDGKEYEISLRVK